MMDLLIDLLITGLMLLSVYGIGRSITRLLPYTFWSRSAEVAFSFGFGAGSVATLLFGLSLVNLLIPIVGWILIVLGLLLAGLHNQDLRADFLAAWSMVIDAAKSSWFIRGMALLGIAFVAINLLGDFAPPIEGDTVHQYLLLPRYWVESGGYVQPSHIWAATLPGNAMFISAWALLLRESYSLATMVTGFGISLLTALSIYALARLHFDRGAAGLAVVAYYTMPDSGYLAQSAKVDMTWALFEVLALAAFFKWIEYPLLRQWDSQRDAGTKWLILSGIFIGLAAGTKIQTFISVALLGGWVFTRYVLNGRIGDAFKSGSIFALSVVTTGFPFYLYNLVVHRSPFYPVFADQFAALLGGTSSPRSELGTEVFYAWNPIGYVQNIFGMSFGHNPDLNFYLGFIVGPIFLLVIPVGVVLGLYRGKRAIWKMLVYTFVFSLIWFVVKQAARHFVPGLALLSVIVGFSLWKLNNTRGFSKQFVLVAAQLVIVGNIFTWLAVMYWNGAYRVGLSIDSRLGYLQRWHDQVATVTYPDWETIEFLNTLPDARIIAEHANSSLYIAPDLVSPYWGDRLEYAAISDEELLIQTMEAHNIGYILVPHSESDLLFNQPDFLADYGELIYDGERNSLYKVVYASTKGDD